MFKSRLCIPIETIVNEVFNGDYENAIRLIRLLVERNLVEFTLNNRITPTVAGKMKILNLRSNDL
jgi:hypothetical protein